MSLRACVIFWMLKWSPASDVTGSSENWDRARTDLTLSSVWQKSFQISTSCSSWARRDLAEFSVFFRSCVCCCCSLLNSSCSEPVSEGQILSAACCICCDTSSLIDASLLKNICKARMIIIKLDFKKPRLNYRIVQNKGKESENFYQKLKSRTGTRKLNQSILTAVPVEIFRLSFCVFACACPTVISSMFGKSFHFPFPYFVLFVLWYFNFHVVYRIVRTPMISSHLIPV